MRLKLTASGPVNDDIGDEPRACMHLRDESQRGSRLEGKRSRLRRKRQMSRKGEGPSVVRECTRYQSTACFISRQAQSTGAVN